MMKSAFNNNATRQSEIVAKARAAFNSHVTKDVSFRKEQLKALRRMLCENQSVIIEALKQDLRKPAFETICTEIDFVKNDITSMLLSIDSWTKPKAVPKTIVTLFDDSFVQSEPYGVVLIIGAWNYPIQLTLSPLVGCIAAGNCAVVKPSEVTPASAELIQQLLPRYLNKECFHVITGGPEETQLLLKEKFDYIFYTGSTQVGKFVNQLAAKNLTPVTLEMGGKSPVYLDETVPNLRNALKRILWGKCLNAGQTCVAPDYVLCTQKVQEMITSEAKKVLKDFFGEDPRMTDDYSRLVNDKHLFRLEKLLQSTSGKQVVGGKVHREERYISPTILTDVQPNDSSMQEEIFGPILPILVVSGPDEAIKFVNNGEKPLSLYLFTSNNEVINKFITQTSSGSICVNDTVIHLAVDSLPFGGVGESGIGAYHGEYSFDTFSHKKAILIRSWNPLVEALGSFRYPPYSAKNLSFMQFLLQKRRTFPGGFSHLLTFTLGVAAMYLYQIYGG